MESKKEQMMPISWEEVIKKKEYQTLIPEEQSRAKTQYFNDVVRPNIPQEKALIIEKWFYADTERIESEQRKVGIWGGFVKPTLKAIPRVAGATIGAAIAFPVSGIAGYSKLLTSGMEEAGKTIEEVGGLPMRLLKTPEQEKAIEIIFKPFEWLKTVSTFYGDKVYDWTHNADLAAGTSTAFETIALFGLPGLKTKLTRTIKARNIKATKAAIKEVHTERLRVLREEPKRFEILAKKEATLKELEAFKPPKKSAKESVRVFEDAFKELQNPVGLRTYLKEIGAERVPQPITPGRARPYAEPVTLPKVAKPRAEIVYPDTEAFIRKAHKTITKGKIEYGIKERVVPMPEDLAVREYGLKISKELPKPTPKEKGHIAKLKQLLKSERGTVELPDTSVIKHQRLIEENPSWKKVHGMIGKEKKSFDLSGFATKVNEKLFDRFAQIGKVSKETYNEARIFSAYKDIAKIKYEELRAGLKNVKNDELLFTDYVSAYRALTRAERGLKNPNKVTLIDAKQTIGAIEKTWRESGKNIKDLRDSFRNFQNWTTKYILDEALDSGLISKKAHADIKKNNKFYATFEVLEHLPPDLNRIPNLPSKEYFSVVNQAVIKKMIGTEKKITNPIEATVRKFTQAQATFARNKVASVFIESVAVEMFRPIAMSKKEFAIMKNQGRNPIMQGVWSEKEFGTINRFKNGRLERYLAPIEITEAMKQLTPTQAPRVIQAINAVFRKSATTVYIPFTISNAMRDAYMAYTTSPVYTWYAPHKFAKDWAKGFWEGAKHEFLGKSDLAKEYIKSGGGFGYVGNLRQINLARQGLFKKGIIKTTGDIITAPFKLIEHISATVELAPRLGIFDRAKMMGFTSKEAALLAKQSTIDFNRGGTWTKVANQWIPFLNARVQGRVTLASALKRDPKGTLAKIATSVVVPGAVTYAWNRLYFSDLYDDIPEYIKQNYFIIITGTAKDARGKEAPRYLVISKGDVGQMAWNPIEFGLDEMWEKDREGTGAFLINYLNDLSPLEFAREGEVSLSKLVGGLTPPIVKGFVEDWANISLYRGREIVPYYMKKTKPPELQYKELTPETYKWLGKKLKISPLRLQNFASNILAGYGREGLDPQAMLRGLTGRLVKVRGGDKESKTWVIIKDIEQGYIYTRAYAQEMIENGQRSEAIKLLNDWNKGLAEQIKEVGKFGFRDKGGLRKAYRFNAEKKRNLFLKRKDERTALERKLSR